jgi:hypothetical protein
MLILHRTAFQKSDRDQLVLTLKTFPAAVETAPHEQDGSEGFCFAGSQHGSAFFSSEFWQHS